MTNEERQQAIEWLKRRPITMPGAKKMFALAVEALGAYVSWIPVTKKMPEEKDSFFAKFWGTDKWNEYMFRGRSELVEVTVELEDGTRYTDASRTRDGKWDIEMNHGAVKKKVVAWKPMSEPWKGE
jgi:hypothetical protein